MRGESLKETVIGGCGVGREEEACMSVYEEEDEDEDGRREKVEEEAVRE